MVLKPCEQHLRREEAQDVQQHVDMQTASHLRFNCARGGEDVTEDATDAIGGDAILSDVRRVDSAAQQMRKETADMKVQSLHCGDGVLGHNSGKICAAESLQKRIV